MNSPNLGELGRVARILVVFCRYPRLGAVKTRLARDRGGQAAFDLYRAFLRDLAAELRDAPFSVRWAVAPPDEGLANWLDLAPPSVLEQLGPDLGARMACEMRRGFSEGAGACIIIGTDMPHLSLAAIDDAFEALSTSDLVLGPARDGGYYLIGMRRFLPIFDGIAWGSDTVLAATLERARRHGVEPHLLEPGFDVDTGADLASLAALLELPDLRRRLPHTAQVLQLLGMLD